MPKSTTSNERCAPSHADELEFSENIIAYTHYPVPLRPAYGAPTVTFQLTFHEPRGCTYGQQQLSRPQRVEILLNLRVF